MTDLPLAGVYRKCSPCLVCYKVAIIRLMQAAPDQVCDSNSTAPRCWILSDRRICGQAHTTWVGTYWGRE